MRGAPSGALSSGGDRPGNPLAPAAPSAHLLVGHRSCPGEETPLRDNQESNKSLRVSGAADLFDLPLVPAGRKSERFCASKRKYGGGVGLVEQWRAAGEVMNKMKS